jgi:hypothetical protein
MSNQQQKNRAATWNAPQPNNSFERTTPVPHSALPLATANMIIYSESFSAMIFIGKRKHRASGKPSRVASGAAQLER